MRVPCACRAPSTGRLPEAATGCAVYPIWWTKSRRYRRGTRLFLFDDEQFLPPGDARRGRGEAFAQELARHELKIAFTIRCRPDEVEEGTLRRLQQIGL